MWFCCVQIFLFYFWNFFRFFKFRMDGALLVWWDQPNSRIHAFLKDWMLLHKWTNWWCITTRLLAKNWSAETCIYGDLLVNTDKATSWWWKCLKSDHRRTRWRLLLIHHRRPQLRRSIPYRLARVLPDGLVGAERPSRDTLWNFRWNQSRRALIGRERCEHLLLFIVDLVDLVDLADRSQLIIIFVEIDCRNLGS